METIGAFAAKTHLPRLLREVAQGHEIIITKHGTAVARLVPMERKRTQAIDQIIQALREFRTREDCSKVNTRKFREEGRR